MSDLLGLSIGAANLVAARVDSSPVSRSSPLVAADGSEHRSEVLLVDALEAMARTIGNAGPIAFAVPAHWSEKQVAALGAALQANRALAPEGVAPTLISDATTALAALYTKPGFPTDGVMALCDFGATGASVTLTDAASEFRQIGQTFRYADFSGDQVDQLILRHLSGCPAPNSRTLSRGRWKD